MALTDGLVSWWDLDQDAATVSDQHGSNDLTENGTVTVSTDGPGSKSVSTFDSTSDYLDLSTTPIVDYSSTFSLSVWAKADSFSSTTSTIVNHRVGSTETYFWLCFRGSTTDRISFFLWDGSTTSVIVDQTAAPSTGQWYHIVATHSGSSLELFIDGSSNDSASTTGLGAFDTGSANFRVGHRWDLSANNQLPGDVAMLGIWDRVLSGAEITSLYNSGNGLQYADLDATTTTQNRIDQINYGSHVVPQAGLNGDLIG